MAAAGGGGVTTGGWIAAGATGGGVTSGAASTVGGTAASGLGSSIALPPSAGMQFFGHVAIEGATGRMTVTLRDRADVELWSTTLDPKVG